LKKSLFLTLFDLSKPIAFQSEHIQISDDFPGGKK